MPVTPSASAAPATKKISVTRSVLVQKAVPKGLVPAKPLPGSYGMPFNPFGLPQPRWPVPVSRPATLSTAAALRLVSEGHGTSTPVHAEAAITENDEETLAEGAAVEMDTDAPSSSDSEEDIPRRKRVRIVSPATEPAVLTLTPRVAIAPMSSTTTVKTPSLPLSKRTASCNPSAASSSSKRNAPRSLPAAPSPSKRNSPCKPPAAPSSSKRHASRALPAAPSPKKPKPAPQLRKKVDTRTAQQKRKDSTLPTGKLAFRKHSAAAAAAAAATANHFPGSAPAKPLTPPQASSSGAATATAAPSSPGLRGRQDEDDFKTVVIKEMLQRRVDRNIEPPAEDFLD